MSRREPDLVVAYGTDPRVLVPAILEALGAARTLPSSGTVGVKPNLVVAKPASSGATTDPAVVAAVIEWLRGHGRRDVVVLESSWVGERTDRAFDACGYRELSRRYAVPLVDLAGDETVEREFEGRRYELCRRPLELAFLINVPVLKAHCQTRLTCALKNLKGCIPAREKRRFHELGLHEPIADLNALVRSDLVVVDGLLGDLAFEEGGTPVRMDRLMASRDPVLVDAYGAGFLGYEVDDVPYVRLAERRAVGSADVARATVVELNRPEVVPSWPRGGLEELLRPVRAEGACSPCLAAVAHGLRRFIDGGGRPPERLQVGQGFRGRSGTGVGVGACAAGFEHAVGGCPPTARAVVELLEALSARRGPTPGRSS